jgi:hypothetical protein
MAGRRLSLLAVIGAGALAAGCTYALPRPAAPPGATGAAPPPSADQPPAPPSLCDRAPNPANCRRVEFSAR